MANPLLDAKDPGSSRVSVAASVYTAITAGGAGDDTLVTGVAIDRENLALAGGVVLSNVIPEGALILVSIEATLAAAATISILNAKIEDSADGTNWATIYDSTGSAAPVPAQWQAPNTSPIGVAATGPTGGGTVRCVVPFSTDLGKARQYVRFDFTPDMSATSVDTAHVFAIAVLSGIDEVPAGVR